MKRIQHPTDYQLLIGAILPDVSGGAETAEIVDARSGRYDYRTFVGRLSRLAAGLASLGVVPGDVVAVLDWDSHRYLECYFAIPMMGAVIQTVNPRLSTDQLSFCLRSRGAAVLLIHEDFRSLLDGMRDVVGRFRSVVFLQDETTNVGSSLEYESLLASSAPEFEFPVLREQTIATTFHTTGTTGDPKAVSFSHRQIVLHTLALAAALANQPQGQGFARGDVYMPLTPMFHVHAWGLPYVATMLGVKQVYPGRYDPARLVELHEDEGVTFSHCVPTVLRMLLAEAREQRRQTLAPWTLIIGGSALPTTLVEEAESFGIAVVGGYGMSETGPVVSLARTRAHGDGIDTVRSAGFTLPLVRTRIADERMQMLPHDGNAQGELIVRAPWVTQSYVGDDAASAELWRGGWMHTQDVATIDPDGRILIRDRLKDVVKTGGEWVSSAQLEDLLARHPLVREAAVIGIPDERWGETPLAVLVRETSVEGSLDERTVLDHLSPYVERGELNRIAVPRKVLVMPELPKTSVGKIDKKELRRVAASLF